MVMKTKMITVTVIIRFISFVIGEKYVKEVCWYLRKKQID